MSILQEEDVSRATTHLLAGLRGPRGVILCGSSLAPYGDAFSRLDFLVLAPGRGAAAVARPVRTGGLRYHYFVRPFDAFAAEVAGHADEALYLLRHGRVVHDPDGRAGALWQQARSVGAEVWAGKSEAAYREFRRRRASLAWTLRRGQFLLALDNVTQMIERALALCCYLQQEPPPARKWLSHAALRTPAGDAARPAVLELLAALDSLSVLGGSYAPRQNRLYLAAGRLQAAIEEEATRRWRS